MKRHDIYVEGKAINAWYCSDCGSVMRTEDVRCCCPGSCAGCGGEITESGWTMCAQCRAKRDAERLEKAIASARYEPDWDGPVFSESGQHYDSWEDAEDDDAMLPWWGAREVQYSIDPNDILGRMAELGGCYDTIADLRGLAAFDALESACQDMVASAMDVCPLYEEDRSVIVRKP